MFTTSPAGHERSTRRTTVNHSHVIPNHITRLINTTNPNSTLHPVANLSPTPLHAASSCCCWLLLVGCLSVLFVFDLALARSSFCFLALSFGSSSALAPSLTSTLPILPLAAAMCYGGKVDLTTVLSVLELTTIIYAYSRTIVSDNTMVTYYKIQKIKFMGPKIFDYRGGTLQFTPIKWTPSVYNP